MVTSREGFRHQAELIAAVVFAMTLSLGAFAQSPQTHQHSFGDAKQWSHVFDDPQRDAWQKPHEVIQALGLKPDAAVADIGAGTGYFSMRLANMLPQGRVYAVDVEPGMVKHLAERAKSEGLQNVSAVLAKPDDARIPAKVDVILMVDVHHHIDRRADYFRRLEASLKPGGRIAVIDFTPESPQGPPKSSRVHPDRVTAELATAGYKLVQSHAFLPYQYFLVFVPAK